MSTDRTQSTFRFKSEEDLIQLVKCTPVKPGGWSSQAVISSELDLGKNFYWNMDEEFNICISKSFEVHSDTGNRHFVTLSNSVKKTNPWSIKCACNWLTGNKVNIEDRREAVKKSITFLPDGSAKKEEILDKALKSRSIFYRAGQTACGFWKVVKGSDWGKGCKHCATINEIELRRFIEESQSIFEEQMGVSTDSKDSLESEDSDLPKDALVRQLYLDGAKTPHCLVGDAGTGKTHSALEVAKLLKAKTFLIGGNSDTRPVDFTGHWVKTQTGMAWKDGKLSKAIRTARTEMTVLIIDEIFRIESEHLSVLLSVLVPQDGKYKHETGRMINEVDGLGEVETIECPVENLIIIATSNLGVQYGVTDRDPALRRRFREIDVKLTEKKIYQVCFDNLIAAGVDPSEAGVDAERLKNLFKKMSKAKKDGALEIAPNLGIFSRCIAMAKGDSIQLELELKKEVLQFVGYSIDGEPNQVQVQFANKLITSCFRLGE